MLDDGNTNELTLVALSDALFPMNCRNCSTVKAMLLNTFAMSVEITVSNDENTVLIFSDVLNSVFVLVSITV